MKNKDFKDLLTSIDQARKIHSGKVKTARVFTLPKFNRKEGGMTAENWITVDIALWLILLAVLWTGPEIMVKISISILIVAQMAILSFFRRIIKTNQ